MENIVLKTHWISAAHRLFRHGGLCKNIHGHNYKLTFALEGDLNDQGMVMDFGDIKAAIISRIDKEWDHALILEESDPLFKSLATLRVTEAGHTQKFVCMKNAPTAENMAIEFAQIAQIALNKIQLYTPPRLVFVEVQETQGACARYYPE